MATEKTALDYVNDFFEGFYDTAVNAPIALGDFLARISGYRDYQFTKDSVLDLDSDLYQKQALNELRILYEVATHETSRNLIIDILVQDIQDKPAYYLGGMGTTTAIGKTFTNGLVKNAYKSLITGTKVEEKVHELYGSVENFLAISDEEFMNFVNNNMQDTSWLDNSNESYIDMAQELGVEKVLLDDVTYGLVTKESIEGLIGTDAEAWEAFLEANPWLQVEEDYLLFDYSKELIFPESILPESSAGHNENFSSPLVLDLNANGTTSTFIAQSETYFDMDGDGFKERTSWTESTDGLLALDKNQDGIINNGSELFGNYTKLANGTNAKNGFEALSQYDLNKDNIIDNKDSIYAHLKVWSDANSDGISTSDELKTLQELNISQINLASTKTSTSEAYNMISDSSTFTQNGQTKTINDVWFYQNKSDTTYTYTKPIKDSVAVLPTIEGSGRVKDLRDAMNDDSVLEAKVTTLTQNASSQTFTQFSTSFKDMVARWSGTDTISALGKVFGSGNFYFLTCKHFQTAKSLHVRNEIQHKGARSGEKNKVA